MKLIWKMEAKNLRPTPSLRVNWTYTLTSVTVPISIIITFASFFPFIDLPQVQLPLFIASNVLDIIVSDGSRFLVETTVDTKTDFVGLLIQQTIQLRLRCLHKTMFCWGKQAGRMSTVGGSKLG